MSIATLRSTAFVIRLVLCAGVGALGALSLTAGDAKKAIVLPKDPKAVVLSYDPGAGGFVRKGEPPYLKVQADGAVTVTNLFDGTRKEATLSAKQLDELLRFVIQEQDFFGVTEAKIAAGVKDAAGKGPFFALGGVGTSVVRVQANGKQHEVRYHGAAEFLRAYPKVEVLARFAAVEKRLADFAGAVAKAK